MIRNIKKQLERFILTWLRITAKLQLHKNRPLAIGVTGSAGKTSTIRVIDAVLKKSPYSYKTTLKGNSETGIPLEILHLKVKNRTQLEWIFLIFQSLWQLLFYWPKYKVFVVEMGIDSDQEPKNMSYLLKIIQPTIGVLLNVNNVHGQNFSGKNTLAAIANEKGKLLTSLPKDGLAIYSQDHTSIDKIASNIRAKKQTFSIKQRAQVQLLKYRVSLKGTEFVFLSAGQQLSIKLKNQLLAKESFGGIAVAIIIGQYLKLKTENIITAIEANLKLLPGRSSLIEGINHSYIIDSSYNSSLEPTVAALNMLREINHAGKKIAVLGDMREIGQQEKAEHEKLAETAAKTADEIFLIGPITKKYTLPKLKKLRFAKSQTHSYLTAYQALADIKKTIDKQDLILVKGSQNTIFLEIIVKEIMAHPERAKQLLCRQTRYWENQRRKLK